MVSETHIDPDPPKRRSRARRVGLWTASGVALIVIGVLLTVLLVLGQTMRAPDWLRDRVEAQVEQHLGGLQLRFGDVDFVIREGWRPRVRLLDVELSDASGQVIARMADAQASLSMPALLRGRLQPRRILLSGASATLRRDRDGALSLSFGDAAAPMLPARTMPELIEQADRIMLLPAWSSLTGVDMQALTLRYEDARQGRGWTLDGGRVRLNRDGNDLTLSSSFSLLSGRDYASLVEANYASVIGETEARFGISVQDIPAEDIAAQSVVVGWLKPLRAPISGAMRGSVDADGVLGPLSATLQIGQGVLQPNDQTRPIPFEQARTYFTYEPDGQVLRFDEISVQSEWVTGEAEGKAWLGGIENGTLTDLTGQVALTSLALNPARTYREALVLDGAEADFRMELTPFRVSLGQMHLRSGDQRAWMFGDLVADPDGWRLSLDGELDQITPDRLMALWPEGALPDPRRWVQENVFAGVLSDANFALRSAPGAPPMLYGDFDFRDATVRVNRNLPLLTGAAGMASLADNRFVVTATNGVIEAEQGGAVDIAGSSFIIPDVRIKKSAPGIVRAQASGAVTAVLSLLNRPPMSVLKDTPLPVDMAQGILTAAGTLSVPLRKGVPFSEVEFHAKGTITDVASTVLVPGHALTSDSLEVRTDQTQLILSGDARIDTVPVTMRWRQPLGKGVEKRSRVEGRIELSQVLVDTFGIGLPDRTVSGQGSGDFTLDLVAGSPPLLSLQSDLEGVGLRVPSLGWAKPEAASGRFELTGLLGEKAEIDHLMLDASGLTATGSVVNKSGGGLDRALLSSVRLGGWLDASVELVGRNAATPDLVIHGGQVDMRRATFGEGSGGAAGPGPSRIDVRLSRLQITDTIALTDFTGQFNGRGDLKGSFRGKVNGGTEVIGEVTPQNGRSAFRIQSQDAGGVFRSAGILPQARSGKMDLTLMPSGPEGTYEGAMKVRDTRVRDVPAIAALLDAASIVGLIDEMAGQGIWFSEVDARFQLTPDLLTLYRSSAIGPSMGFSMDGRMDLDSGRLGMQGVISPMYLVNGIGALLTRKGEGLIGFNYTLRGTSDAPQVQVNPLSALTPGMFREIFRTAPPPVPKAGIAPQADTTPISPARKPVQAGDR